MLLGRVVDWGVMQVVELLGAPSPVARLANCTSGSADGRWPRLCRELRPGTTSNAARRRTRMRRSSRWPGTTSKAAWANCARVTLFPPARPGGVLPPAARFGASRSRGGGCDWAPARCTPLWSAFARTDSSRWIARRSSTADSGATTGSQARAPSGWAEEAERLRANAQVAMSRLRINPTDGVATA